MKILLLTFFAMLIFAQCPNQSSDKELELKEKELALKEKELAMEDADKDKDDEEVEDDKAEEETEKKESATDDDDEKEKPKKSAKSNEKPKSSGTTPIKFDRGKSSKTVSASLKKGQSKKYSLDVGKGQVINVNVLTDGGIVNLMNGKNGVDNWEDGSGYLSVLTGRKGVFIIEIVNQFNEDVTIPMKVTITNNPDDYQGGL